jgi:hypothetical protein
VEAAIAGWLICYSPRISTSYVVATIDVPLSVFRFEHSLMTCIKLWLGNLLRVEPAANPGTASSHCPCNRSKRRDG